MSVLNKTKQMQIRLTDVQVKRLERAAKYHEVRRGETIPVSTLFRDLGLQALEVLLRKIDRDSTKKAA